MSEKPSFEDFLGELESENWDQEYLDKCLTDEECKGIWGGYGVTVPFTTYIPKVSEEITVSGGGQRFGYRGTTTYPI